MPSPAARQLSDQTIASTLATFQVSATPELCQSIRDYVDLLLLWNQKVNLTTITDPLEILSRHFGESMFAASVVPSLHGRLADVGSGAGFPGLALKILCPDLEVFLIESVMKKATFLAEVVRHLGLSNVKVVVSRFEDLRDDLAHLDYICARALGERHALLAWASLNLNIGGQVLLWLGAEEAQQLSPPKGGDPNSQHLHQPVARSGTTLLDGSLSNSLAESPPQKSVSSRLAPTTESVKAEGLAAQAHNDCHQSQGHTPLETLAMNGPTMAFPCEQNLPRETWDTLGPPPSVNPDVPRGTSEANIVNKAPVFWNWASPIRVPRSLSRYLVAGQLTPGPIRFS